MPGGLRVSCYRLEGAEIQVGCQTVLRGQEQIHLRAKTFQVLLYLLENRSRLVPKQELFDVLWTDTAVTDASLVQCIIDLRKAFADDARNPRYIRTVPRVGYQFIAPITEVVPFDSPTVRTSTLEIDEYVRCEVEYEEISEPAPEQRPAGFALPRRTVIYALSAVAILGIVTAALLIGGARRAEAKLPHISGRTRVAVLYFENQSRSPRLDWLREGLADMLITDLSRSPSLTVLSRIELHFLLDRSGISGAGSIGLDDALMIARKSHAEVVAIGSFAQLGDKIRIELQLHSGQTGRLLAAESIVFEGDDRILSDVGLLSLRVARDLGAGPRERDTPAASLSMTSSLEAYRYYSLGVEKAEAYHNKEANELLEKAIALDPGFAMAYARIGYNYGVAWILPDRARPYLEKAFALSGRLTERDRLNINAWYAVANRDYPAAVERYRELTAAFPYETEAYVQLGMLLRGEERFEEAVAVLSKGLAIDPDRKELYNTLGGIYSQQGRHEEALAMQRRHVALAPQEPNAHDSLGLAYLWAGRYAEAEEAFLRSKELDPGFDLVIGHMGMLDVAMGRYREALEAFEKQGGLAPSELQLGDAESSIAQVLWRRGEKARAIESLSRAAAHQPGRQIVPMMLALWRGDERAAALLSSQLLHGATFTHRGARPPLKRIEYYLLGQFALLQGRNEVALENFREALRHWSGLVTFDTFEDCLGDAYLRLGRLDEAIAEYERLLGLFPGSALARYHLGVAYARRGRPEQARNEFTRFLELWKQADPEVPEVKAAREFVRAGTLPALAEGGGKPTYR
jgi:tetratricopeptide (TPR) repeat protein/DNA-binding winged helix-turn-helix (wHTH) protein/TolB-like protein